MSTERVTVTAGQSIQSAIDSGVLAIDLEPGVTYQESIVLSGPCALDGHGAAVRSIKGKSAIVLPPGAHHVSIEDLDVNADYDQQVILAGSNDSKQTQLDDVPFEIAFRGIRCDSFRGKRVFEINATKVTIADCIVTDLYAKSGQDSCCIGIMNTPGEVAVERCTLQGGTTVLFVGGDTMKLLGGNLVPADLQFIDCDLSHDLAWQNGGPPIKNLLELKSGERIRIARCRLDGSWQSGQDGYCFVLTPRNSLWVSDVTIEDCVVDHCAGLANVMGRDYSTCSPKQMAHVVFRNITATVSKAKYGGHGNGILTQAEPKDVTIDNVTWTGDGGAFFEYTPNSYMTPDGGKVTSGPIDTVAITGGGFNTGQYGSIRLKGYADGAQPVPPVVTAMSVTGATIAGASSTMKKNFPTNTYV